MACGAISRDCAYLPTKDSAIDNVSDISFANGPTGVTVSWSWGALTGTVAIVVIAVSSPYARADYAMVNHSTASELLALTSEEEYFIMVRREDAGLASPWYIHKMLFFSDADAVAVEHSAVQVVHTYGVTIDYVLHTRVDQFLLLEDNDFLVMENGNNIAKEY